VQFSPDGTVRLLTDKSSEALGAIDAIVFASERRSDRSVAELARERGIDTYVIGDAADVDSEDGGTILTNIAQAYDRARAI
jgi:glycerate-2-kinase